MDDFLVTRVGDSTISSTHSWWFLVDFQARYTGGCMQQVKEGQHLLWAYAPEDSTYLKLEGPETVTSGTRVTYTVTNGKNHKPVEGALVDNVTTNAHGEASITFTQSGEYTFKATRSDSVRSNALHVVVHQGNFYLSNHIGPHIQKRQNK